MMLNSQGCYPFYTLGTTQEFSIGIKTPSNPDYFQSQHQTSAGGGNG